MNAKEFVKRFGWLKAISVSNHFSGLFEYKARDGEILFSFQVNDLKQLVDAWELTNRVGNMVECKRLLAMLEKSNIPHMTIGGEFNGRTIEQKVLTTDFKQAIELVESVNGNN